MGSSDAMSVFTSTASLGVRPKTKILTINTTTLLRSFKRVKQFKVVSLNEDVSIRCFMMIFANCDKLLIFVVLKLTP